MIKKLLTVFALLACAAYSFAQAPNIYYAGPQNYPVNSIVNLTPTNTGGAVAASGYTITPILPSGLSIDASTGVISGTPRVTSAAKVYVIKAINTYGNSIDSLTLATIPPTVPPIITSFTPTTAGAGANIIIYGSNLWGITGITIGGVPATTFSTMGPGESSATASNSLVFATTTIAPGTPSGSISVTNPAGTATIAGFTYQDPQGPAISSTQVYDLNKPVVPLAPANSIGTTPNAYAKVTTIAGANGYDGYVSTSLGTYVFAVYGSAVDAAGNIYITDGNYDEIRKITPAGTVSIFAGGSGQGFNDGPGASAKFSGTYGIAIDKQGNLYVSDQYNNRIRKITTGGIVSTLAGNGTAGAINATGTAATFNSPAGIAVDTSGNVYVADQGNNLVRKITPAGVVTTLAGQSGPSADFVNPNSVAVDKSGNVYVSDVGFVKKITPAGVVSIVAGGGITGAGFSNMASFDLPMGVAVDDIGNLYVADYSNYVIKKITPAGNISILAGQLPVSPYPTGSYTGSVDRIGAAAKFVKPVGVTVDGLGNLITTEFGNGLVRKIALTGYSIDHTLPAGLSFDATTGTISGTPIMASPAATYLITANTLAGSTTSAVNITVGKLPNITYTNPLAYTKGVAIAALTLTNTGGAVPANTYGRVTTFAGNTTASLVNGTGTAASFNFPSGLAADAGGNVYVADQNNNTIRKITPAGVVSTLAGSTTPGSANGNGIAASFHGPAGIATDLNGNIYVADMLNSLIRIITPGGDVSNVAGTANRTGFTGGPTTFPSYFNLPTDVKIDPYGNVFVADNGNQQIRQISNGFVSSLAGNLQGFTDGLGRVAKFNAPSSLVPDGLGNIYVSDKNNNRIRKVTSLGNVTTFAGSGAAGSADGTGTAANFNLPGGITIDAPGNFYVADTANNIIRKITPAGIVTTLAGSGAKSSVDSVGTAAAFTALKGITNDNLGNIYVTDNNIIRKITVTGYTINPALPAGLSFDSKTGTISGTPTTTFAATTYTVTAYNTSGSNSSTVTLSASNPIAQTITFGPLAAVNYGATDITLSATASSGLPVSYTSSDTTVATIVNGKIHLIKTGTTVVTAQQAGNGIYDAAPPVTQTLIINPEPAPVITAISPLTAQTGTIITITGSNLLGTSSVTFGGVPAASFTIVSPTSITAIVGSGSSGNVVVTTPTGTDKFAGFSFVPVPTISAGGPTTIITGGSVTLTASPGTGYNYQWIKDGVNINGATGATYNASQSGSYAVSITLNSVSQQSTTIGVNTVFELPATNFQLTTNGVSCKGSTNGSVNITAVQNLNYTATITGNGLNTPYAFTNSVQINNLAPGTYNVCITVAGQTGYQQCFTAVIIEPKDLSVYTAFIKTDNQVVLTLGGAATYNIILNGTTYTTTNNEITLPLSKGNNSITVSTDKICQGTVEKNINVTSDILVYPNPFQGTLNLKLGNDNIQTAMINVYTLYGKLVYSTKYANISGIANLDLATLQSGNYILKVSADNSDTVFKIIKR